MLLAEKIEHNGPITIQEAYPHADVTHDNVICFDEDHGEIRNMRLVFDHQNGIYLQNWKTGENFYTLSELYQAGITQIYIETGIEIETDPESEESYRA